MALENFYYELPLYDSDGAELAPARLKLPKYKNIPFGLIRKNRGKDPGEQVFSLIESLLSERDLEVVDSARQDDVIKLLTAWQKDSGLSEGESEAS